VEGRPLTKNLRFRYKDWKHIVYTAADHSNPAERPNYDVWWMNADTGKKVRITFAPGLDVLPVLNRDGNKLLWTSTRDGRQPAQLYIADFVPPKDE
jgi:Tol biopolymer transport system component